MSLSICLPSSFILHWMWLNEQSSPVVLDFKPQGVGGVHKVPSSCLNEEPILDPALKQQLVQDLILVVVTQSIACHHGVIYLLYWVAKGN